MATNRSYVNAVYMQELGRPYDPATDGTFWWDAMNNGTSQADVSAGLNRSAEGVTYDANQAQPPVQSSQAQSPYSAVDQAYQQELGRPYDPATDGTFWWDAMNAGTPYTDVVAGINADNEGVTYDVSQTQGDVYDVNQVYMDELGRSYNPDTDGTFWSDAVNNGLSQSDLVSGISGDREGVNYDFINDAYQQELGRDYNSARDGRFWIDALNNGTPRVDILSGISGDKEGVEFDPADQLGSDPGFVPTDDFSGDLQRWQDLAAQQTPGINDWNNASRNWSQLEGQRAGGGGIASVLQDSPGQLYQTNGEAYRFDPSNNAYRSINTGNVIGQPGTAPRNIAAMPNYSNYTPYSTNPDPDSDPAPNANVNQRRGGGGGAR